MRAAIRVALVAFRFADCSARLECLGDLFIQFNAVSDDNKRPVPDEFPEYLLRKKHHRKTFTAALRLPEYTTATVAELACFQHRSDSAIHAKELVILPNDLHQPSFVL